VDSTDMSTFGLGPPLDNLLLKVERAKKHFLELEAAENSFHQSKPYRFRFEGNPQTGERDYYLAEAEPIPEELSLIIGDALNNLRSALDHTAYQLACVGAGAIKPFPNVKFPTGDNEKQYRHQRAKALKGMRQDAVKAIDALEPYAGGKGEHFWQLARLNNFDKHRLLITTWAHFSGHTAFRSDRELLAKFHGGQPDDYKTSFMAPGAVICPLKPGDKLFSVHESEVDENMIFLLNLAFAEPEIARGKPVFQTLHDMTLAVRHLIFEFDRNGLFR